MLLLGRKLPPCNVMVPPGATLVLPLSERVGEKTVRPRPTNVARIISRAAMIIAAKVRQPVEPPVDPPVEPPGLPDGICGG